MRKRIFTLVEVAEHGDSRSRLYDSFMSAVILFSLVPLFFKSSSPIFRVIEYASITVFSVDYLLRWITADLKLPRFGRFSFLVYPFTPMALIDLVSILPVLLPLHAGLKLLRLFRLFRALRALRILRYSHSFRLILDVIKREKRSLLAVCWLAAGYVVLSALILFTAEPDIFDTFFDAIYWAMVTLTTVGYGDIYPVSNLGRLIGMVSSFMGIAIVALPTGIITAGFMSSIQSNDKE